MPGLGRWPLHPCADAFKRGDPLAGGLFQVFLKLASFCRRISSSTAVPKARPFGLRGIEADTAIERSSNPVGKRAGMDLELQGCVGWRAGVEDSWMNPRDGPDMPARRLMSSWTRLTLDILRRCSQHLSWRLWGASALHCLFCFLTDCGRVRLGSADR